MEFELIHAIRARAAVRDDVILGIGDDAAVLRVPADRQLVVAMDTLNLGVHFPEATAPADIGWKALAVNLSDLAAMGARPAWCTLSLSLPRSDATWLDAFLDGFLALAAQHDVALVGGDTTRGPLSVCVTVHGLVEPDRILRRDGARPGDEIWVSGTLGDAAAALALLLPLPPGEGRGEGPEHHANALAHGSRRSTQIELSALRTRLDRPVPRIETGLRLAEVAHAAIDISDGLLADLGHIGRASGVAAEIELDRLPASEALCAAFEPVQRRALQATGGDDYELCFTAPAGARAAIEEIAAATGIPLTCIGRIIPGEGVVALNEAGQPWHPPRPGYGHFS